jgi:general secretion pathway protein J
MRKHAALVAPSGFTLIELLVALTLMALLSVILFGGLRFGMRAWETGGERIEQVSHIETVQNLLRREVSQARVPPRTADSAAPPSFAGTSDELTFVAPLPVHRGVGGSYLFRLGLREHEGRANLALRWQVYRPEGYLEHSALIEDETTLLEDVEGIALSYYGAAGPELPMQWQDTWDGENGKPRVMRLRVAFPPSDARRWPDLIIRLP